MWYSSMNPILSRIFVQGMVLHISLSSVLRCRFLADSLCSHWRHKYALLWFLYGPITTVYHSANITGILGEWHTTLESTDPGTSIEGKELEEKQLSSSSIPAPMHSDPLQLDKWSIKMSCDLLQSRAEISPRENYFGFVMGEWKRTQKMSVDSGAARGIPRET